MQQYNTRYSFTFNGNDNRQLQYNRLTSPFPPFLQTKPNIVAVDLRNNSFVCILRDSCSHVVFALIPHDHRPTGMPIAELVRCAADGQWNVYSMRYDLAAATQSTPPCALHSRYATNVCLVKQTVLECHRSNVRSFIVSASSCSTQLSHASLMASRSSSRGSL